MSEKVDTKAVPMTVSAAIDLLTRISNTQAHNGERTIAVRLHKPGSIGGTPCAPVVELHAGIDWDSGRVLLTLDRQVTDLTEEQVAAILESVRKGQSWHSYQQYKELRRERAALLAANESLAKDAERWKHIANEWADEATNGVQYLANVRDGISTPEECTRSALENIQRIRALAASAGAPVIHVETALEVAARKMRDWGVTLSTKRKGADAALAASASAKESEK